MVDVTITSSLLPEIGKDFIACLMEDAAIKFEQVAAKDGNFVIAFD